MSDATVQLAHAALEGADDHLADLVAWHLADHAARDTARLLALLDDLDGPSIYEQMTGNAL